MVKRKQNGPLKLTAADIAKLSPKVRAQLGIEPEVRGQRSEVRKPAKASAPREFEVSWYSPRLQRRVKAPETFAGTKHGAIAEAKAAMGFAALKKRREVLPVNFMARQVNGKIRRQTAAAVGRKKNSRQSAAAVGRKRNLFGIGTVRKAVKKRRRRAARIATAKAGIANAKAALAKARARNRGSSKAKPKVRQTNSVDEQLRNLAERIVDLTVELQQKHVPAKMKQMRAQRRKLRGEYNKLAITHAGEGRKGNPGILEALAASTNIALGSLALHDRFKRKPKRLRKKNSAKSKVVRAKNKAKAASSRRSPNHTRSTKRLYKEFHGHDPKGKVLNLYTPPGTPKDVSFDGPVIEIRLENGRSVKFAETDRGALRSPKAYMGHAQRGASKRIYIGLKQPFGSNENGEAIARSANHGPITAIAYWCAKPHLNGHSRMVPWEHKFGDRGGRLPNLILDRTGTIRVRGGDYSVESGGIDN